VSTAKARLPGFLGLADKVLNQLRALPDSPARQLMKVVGELQGHKITGVGGIVAADRIFGLLEREFALKDIEGAVGGALKPRLDASLDAHRILLALSKGPSGKPRLVTTNFDLLFEAADPSSRRWTPSQLPDFRRHADFEGIVHLHGMLDPDYREAVGGAARVVECGIRKSVSGGKLGDGIHPSCNRALPHRVCRIHGR
jgi:hypothetical protein